MTQPLRLVNGDMDGGFDPFNLDNEGYSRDRFYTRSTDGKGNSETKYVKISPTVVAAIGELVASRKVPAYRTEADFIRDAIHHRMHEVGEMIADGRLINVSNNVEMLSRIMAFQQELADVNAIVEQHESVMDTCVTAGDMVTLEMALGAAEGDLEKLKPAYQDKLRTVVDRFRIELKNNRHNGSNGHK